jgi:hypothetical protein
MSVTIGGYTTTYNCIDRQYPLEECVKSLLGFCDQVSIVDAGSTDGTIEVVRKWARDEQRIRFSVDPVDFTHPRWAIHMDGFLKAKARRQCTTDFCWQTDTDEIVPEADWEKVRTLPQLLKDVLDQYPVIYLPMVEFWGSFSTIRADFFTWKQRFSVNHPDITHGIPHEYACYDDAGHIYPRPFDSDSCNYMWSHSRESVPSVVPVEVKNFGMPPAEYDVFFHSCLQILPGVLHVSWLNLERKIDHYRKFWPAFHASMYNLQKTDAPEHNVMFDKSWSAVTDEDIRLKAKELNNLGPRSFHTKLNNQVKGATIPFRGEIPTTLHEWADRAGMI